MSYNPHLRFQRPTCPNVWASGPIPDPNVNADLNSMPLPQFHSYTNVMNATYNPGSDYAATQMARDALSYAQSLFNSTTNINSFTSKPPPPVPPIPPIPSIPPPPLYNVLEEPPKVCDMSNYYRDGQNNFANAYPNSSTWGREQTVDLNAYRIDEDGHQRRARNDNYNDFNHSPRRLSSRWRHKRQSNKEYNSNRRFRSNRKSKLKHVNFNNNTPILSEEMKQELDEYMRRSPTSQSPVRGKEDFPPASAENNIVDSEQTSNTAMQNEQCPTVSPNRSFFQNSPLKPRATSESPNRRYFPNSPIQQLAIDSPNRGMLKNSTIRQGSSGSPNQGILHITIQRGSAGRSVIKDQSILQTSSDFHFIDTNQLSCHDQSSKTADNQSPVSTNQSPLKAQDNEMRSPKKRKFCVICKICFTGSTVDHCKSNEHKKIKYASKPYCRYCQQYFHSPAKFVQHCKLKKHKEACEVVRQKMEGEVDHNIELTKGEVDQNIELTKGENGNEDLAINETECAPEITDKNLPNSESAAIEIDQEIGKTETQVKYDENSNIELPSGENGKETQLVINEEVAMEIDEKLSSNVMEISMKTVDTECETKTKFASDEEVRVNSDKKHSSEITKVKVDKKKSEKSDTITSHGETDIKKKKLSKVTKKTEEVKTAKMDAGDVKAKTAKMDAGDVKAKEKKSSTATKVAQKTEEIKNEKEDAAINRLDTEMKENVSNMQLSKSFLNAVKEPTIPATLPKYDPEVAVGENQIMPLSGSFCRLCRKFYKDKELVNAHCKSIGHYENYQKHLLNLRSKIKQNQ